MNTKIDNEILAARKVIEEETIPMLTVNGATIQFNRYALDLLEAESGDLISIKYKGEDEDICLVIGKSSAFDLIVGNKLTTKHTISYKGIASKELMSSGERWQLESYSEGIFKLIPFLEINTQFNEELDALDLNTLMLDDDEDVFMSDFYLGESEDDDLYNINSDIFQFNNNTL